MWKVSLTAKPQKCVWGTKMVECLGHEVGGGMVKVPELRAKAIAEFRRPIPKTGLKDFLGSIGLLPTVRTRLWSRGPHLNQALRQGPPEIISWDEIKLRVFLFLMLSSNHVANMAAKGHRLFYSLHRCNY